MRPLDRGGRLDRLAALRDATSATPAPPATRGSTRTARYPSGGVPGRAQPGLRRLRRATSSRTAIGQLGGRAGTLTARGGRLDRAARGDRGRRRQRRRARHRARRPGGRARADGRDHGHLDLPRDERATTLAEVPGHVRRRRRRDRPRAVRATRPARAGSATSSAGSSSNGVPDELPRRGRARGASASTST